MMSNLTDVLFGEGSYDKLSNQMGAIEGEAVGRLSGALKAVFLLL